MTDWMPAGPSPQPDQRVRLVLSVRLSQGGHPQGHRYAERINPPLTLRRVLARQAILSR